MKGWRLQANRQNGLVNVFRETAEYGEVLVGTLCLSDEAIDELAEMFRDRSA